jgi:MFS family permease
VLEVVAPSRLGRSFRWLIGSFWVSNLGDGIALSAGPLLVASETHDPFLVALAVVLQRLPWLFFGLAAGVVADRVDRRRIFIAVQLARVAVVAALSATILADRVNIAVVLVVMFLLGTAETFADTTASTLLPMVVAKRDLGIGNARIMAGIVTINQLVGPPIGAVLFASGRVVPFLVEAACTVASALMATRLVLPPHGVDRSARSHVRREISDGFRWLWNNRAVRTLALTIVSFNVTFGASWSVLVLFAIERLHTGTVGFGLLTTAIALGGLVGTATYGWLSARVSLGNLMRAGLIIETLTHLGLAVTTTPWIAYAIMFVFGAHAFVWGTTSTTVRQRVVPTALQGRVTSVYFIGVQGGIVIGSVVGGAIAGVWGVAAPFWFAFVGSGLLVALLWRQFAHIAHADEAELQTEPE